MIDAAVTTYFLCLALFTVGMHVLLSCFPPSDDDHDEYL
jgi:hypothetical protein